VIRTDCTVIRIHYGRILTFQIRGERLGTAPKMDSLTLAKMVIGFGSRRFKVPF